MTKEELFALMEQIAGEREAARPVVEKLASGEEPIDDIEIPDGWRTAGMVLELCERADAVCEIDPRRAVAVLEIALLISAELPCSNVVGSWLKAFVWAEIGYTQTEQGWYDAAFRAYESADRFMANEPALRFYEAKVKLRRAAALGFVRRHGQAVLLSDEAQQIFSEFGDERRVLSCQLANATARYYTGDLRRARVDHEALIAPAEALCYTDFLIRLHNNLGVVCKDLGDSAAAIFHLQRARQLSTDIGHVMLVRKADWGMARTLLAEGKLAEAEPMLRDLRAVFVSQEMVEDAGLAALDLVEILVATKRFSEAKTLIERVITEFQSANLNHHAVMGFGYLRDLLSTTEPMRQAVKQVRTYVEKLKDEPALLFLPLES